MFIYLIALGLSRGMQDLSLGHVGCSSPAGDSAGPQTRPVLLKPAFQQTISLPSPFTLEGLRVQDSTSFTQAIAQLETQRWYQTKQE